MVPQTYLVRVVDQAIQDGVLQRRITNPFVPLAHRQLARHHHRPAVVPVLHHLQQHVPLSLAQCAQAPVVHHEHVHAAQVAQAPARPLSMLGPTRSAVPSFSAPC